MKNKIALAMLTLAGSLALTGCGVNATIYRTPEEWKARWTVPEYHPNKEITDGNYDRSLAVTCTNGTFVGQRIENNKVKTWRGIPFGKINARFERSVDPDKSNKVYEALYFGKSGLQEPNQESEPSSFYEMGDLDTLTLVIATGNNNDKNKPVFVYVHGGAYSCGGTTDPAYDLRNLAYYYPDVIFVDVTYRLGIQGHINLGIKDETGKYVFQDYESNQGKFNTGNNLSILDVVQSLRWVKENIAGFGGDINNITLGGESAGAGFASSILMMASDPDNPFIQKNERLFQKIYSMSGGINQYSPIKDCDMSTNNLIQYYTTKYGKKPTTIKELQEIPFADLKEYWLTSGKSKCTFNVLDGIVLPMNPFDVYNRCVGDDYIVMQGATTNEYDYFREVFNDGYEAMNITHNDCAEATYDYLTKPSDLFPNLEVTDQFKADLNAYIEELQAEGFVTREDYMNELLNDHYLQTVNYYMAQKQAEKGGKTFCYAFGEPYDGAYAKCGAGHAIDCYYFFGSFNGGKSIGTKEQVDFSRRYQEMAVNFIRNGDPSTKDFKWYPYNKDTSYVTVLNKNKIECVKEYHKTRINLAVKMTDENAAMKVAMPWSLMFANAYIIHHGRAVEKSLLQQVLDWIYSLPKK